MPPPFIYQQRNDTDTNAQLGLEGKITGSAVTGPGQDTNNTQIVFRFDDIRDAAKTIDDVTMVDTRWAAVYITQQEYEAAVKQRGHGRETHFYDGQVVFVARPAGEGVHLDHACLYDEIVSLVKRFGRVLIIAPADIVKGTWNVRAEYMRISDAKMAIETLTKHAPEELTVSQPWSSPPMHDANLRPQGWTVIARQRQLVAHGGASINKIATTPHRNAHGMPGEYVESPTGRTAFMRDEDGNPIPMPPPRVIPRVMHQSEPYSEREQSAPTPQTPRTKEVYNPRNLPAAATRGHGSDPRHNQRHDNFVPRESQALDLERVRNGVDVRTSLMLRNIPSCMDSARLIKIFNSHNKGRYNFTYLRFDFGNGCNVGYAFVNFVNPDDVLKFGDNWMGAPWMSELPARVNGRSQLAEISYAHCQGVDGAIERFRNSSVMDEVPGYRPQLWYTKEDAPHPKMVGTEAPFPNHNNEVKLDRSRGNATQHGLYSPAKRNGRGGPQGRSQYDPGTLSQIREDEEFEQSQAQAYAPHQQMAGPSMMMFAPPQNQMHPVAFNTPNGIVFAYPNAVNHQGQMMYAEPHPINDPFHPAAYSYADAQMYGGHHPNSPYFYQPSSPYGNQHGSPYAQQQGSPYAQHNGPHAQHNSLYYQRNGPYVQPNSPQHGTQYGYHHNGVQNGNGHHNGNHHQRGNGSAQYGGGYPDNGHVQNGGFNRNGAAYGEQFDEEYSSYAQHDNDSGDGQRFKPRHP